MKYEMVVRVEVRQVDDQGISPAYTGGLHVHETFPFEAADFSSLCGVLTRFHDLAEEIKRMARGGR